MKLLLQVLECVSIEQTSFSRLELNNRASGQMRDFMFIERVTRIRIASALDTRS